MVLLALVGCGSTPTVRPLQLVVDEPLAWSTGEPDTAPWCTAQAHRTPMGGVRFDGAMNPTYACAFGNAPAADFASAIRRDAVLQACLEMLDEASLADIELVISSRGDVSRVEVTEWWGDRDVTGCARRLLGWKTRAIGCRWRTSTTIARTSWLLD
jgi:hypothetical protein